ncbi:MAG: GNAT family N-acetyltransferase, partial [Spirochaetaceae bacterium]
RKAESGKRKAESGKRKAESGKRKAESGKRKAESGKRKAESGRRKTEDGRRKTEDGRRKGDGGCMEILKLKEGAEVPWDLLLLADPNRALVQTYLDSGSCYIASEDGTAVGVVLILQTGDDVYEIMNVAVREDCQNRGIGKSLVRFAIEKVRSLGVGRIEIGTGNPGVQQLLLYQKCGFRIEGVIPDFFRDNYRERIYENGIECRDMIRLGMSLRV